MSDMNQKLEIDGGKMLSGADGQPSLRRWGALVSFFTSVGFSAWGLTIMAQQNALGLIHLLFLVPSGLFIVVCLVLIGFVNKQNIEAIKALIGKDKP